VPRDPLVAAPTRVLGALALIGPDKVDGELTVSTGVETSRVTFAKLGPEMIDRYPRQRGMAGARRRLCRAGTWLRPWSTESRATSPTSSGYRSGLLLELAPDLDGR